MDLCRIAGRVCKHHPKHTQEKPTFSPTLPLAIAREKLEREKRANKKASEERRVKEKANKERGKE